MQLLVRKYLLKASLLAGLSLLFGLVLSLLVFQANEKVKVQTVDVVEHRLPILSAINELIADLTEQERIVYEYYRSKEQAIFLSSSSNIQRTFAMHLSALEGQQGIRQETKNIQLQQQEIIQLFNRFDQLMDVYEPDWDALREVLTAISNQRLQMLPTLKYIEKITKKQVDEGHVETLQQIDKTAMLVTFYSIFIVVIGVIVAWYIRQYILAQTKSTRLTHFAQRNPNPIISVNSDGEVLFSNPACERLLKQEGFDNKEVSKLIPSNFLALREIIARSNDHYIVIEQTLKNKILQVSVNWLEEFDAYDIHIKDVTEQVVAQQEVKHLAFTSQETGLPNQYKLKEKLSALIESDAIFSLGVIAIRQYNDKVATLGGEVTTSLIRCVANVVSNTITQHVEFYHLGEGEFAVLTLEGEKGTTLVTLANKLNKQTENALVTRYGEFFIEFDFGFAAFPEHANNSNSLLKNAHIALGVACQNPHENYAFFTPEFAAHAEKKAAMTDSLRNAVLLDELFLVYQPQLCINHKKITGIETLVRWRQNGKIVPPIEFIPLAEQSGLIVTIGQWILQQACIFGQKLIEQHNIELVVAVNISPRQFSHPQFIETVEQALEKSGLNPQHLELEITEGVFMHHEKSTLEMMHKLKQLGIQLSIDDFGTGYSSMSYLKQFPIDKLKIDQSFVRDCDKNDQDKAIINSIIGLGKSLGLTLIAEGVEESAHLDILTAMECDEIQGYWFSKPLEDDALIEFIHHH
ncbi:bifunctional diguanylate cyclase/phosphodiesterase [Thalassotalea sp. 1_MG-2023]|uniref:putative bifunctional diguanylate cyclase/phosphodiesterase n=1 Tax=Thalassotalea sp. 1_MG-2023 TaxID=3062680 RepID=UPI0026E34B2D|nr:bifunctional diguanylate cyclase/phosphodiesterase [Thalassotalea sp. 1_MG-2023]MDO6427549.1 bifunctional diguanylate cyclase/phosphodiesterase [Thalassotalea sp. 1_MG-2023]